jgi:hypothetical protein
MIENTLHPISAFDLEWYHFGRLNAGQNLRIGRHLAQCKECAERLEAVERFVEIFGSWLSTSNFVKRGSDGLTL